MKNIFFLILLFVAFSCSSKVDKKKMLTFENKDESSRIAIPNNDTLVLIVFDQSKKFYWNNKASKIVEDSLFAKIRTDFYKTKFYWIDEISDLKKTSATSCGKSGNLVLGDFAFLVINLIYKKLPLYYIFNSQCDSYRLNCQYPSGYFNAINRDRIGIKSRIRTVINMNKK